MIEKHKSTNSVTKSSTKKAIRDVKIKEPKRLNKRQYDFLNLSLDPKTQMMFVSGPAGTSKTYLSIYSALKLLNSKHAEKILYIRSAVESADSKLGYLPGEEAMKLEPYLRPLRDKLMEFLTKTEVSCLYQKEAIAAEHVGFARGQDWKNMVIVIDEAQNLTKKELLTLTTRVGENSTVFIIGDPMQSDIKDKSGLKEFLNTFKGSSKAESHGIYTFEFGHEDIVRSPLVKFIIETIEESDMEI